MVPGSHHVCELRCWCQCHRRSHHGLHQLHGIWDNGNLNGKKRICSENIIWFTKHIGKLWRNYLTIISTNIYVVNHNHAMLYRDLKKIFGTFRRSLQASSRSLTRFMEQLTGVDTMLIERCLAVQTFVSNFIILMPWSASISQQTLIIWGNSGKNSCSFFVNSSSFDSTWLQYIVYSIYVTRSYCESSLSLTGLITSSRN